MASDRRVHALPIGSRADGSAWSISLIEHRGTDGGPATAVLAGMYGDKPMGCLAAHELDRRLAEAPDLEGSVIIAPALNPPAIESRTRANPDHLMLNRRFPGSPTGFLTDQLAHAIQTFLEDSADAVIDLHSGTPEMALWYTYDFGDVELSASFGHLPVVVGHAHDGQLGTQLSRRGIPALLPEFGGGSITSIETGVEGALNVLRYRGNLPGRATGPSHVPIISDRRLTTASTVGALELDLPSSAVGTSVAGGVIGRITNVASGEIVEEFHVDDGAVLLMIRTAPAMVGPGDFVCMVGYPEADIAVPNA